MTETGTPTAKVTDTVKRWTATRKMEIVLRHMQGASLDDLSREVDIAT